MIFNKKLAVAVSGAVLLMAGQFALADSTTDIVDALVSKGVLTEEEGKLISKGHETKKKAEGTVAFKDGFKINSGDGKSNFSVNGRIQADYRQFDTPTAAGTGSGANSDTFDLRRTYLTAKGTFRNFINFEATINPAGAGAGSTTISTLKYYWLEAAFSDKFKVRAGQFKAPMGFDVLTSSRFSDMTERDMSTYLTQSINKGVMVHGVPTTGVTYALMLSNGGLTYEAGETAIENSNTWDGKSVTGRLTANIAEIMGNKEAIAHLGAAYGVDTNLPTGTTAIRTSARGTTFFTSPSLVNPNIDRMGLEGVFAYGPYKLQTEYTRASYQVEGVNDRDIDGYYANISWMVTGEKYADAYKNGLMDRMRPLKDYTGLDSSGWGAWEVGFRYSKIDANDFEPQITATAAATKVDAYTAGIKWIIDPNTRVLFNYIYTDYGRPIAIAAVNGTSRSDHEGAVNVRAQFDF